MGSEDKDQKDCPLHIIIEYLVKPLKEKIKSKVVSEVEILDALKSASSLQQFMTSLDELQFPLSSRKECEDVLVSLIRDVCFPMIYSLQHLHHSEKGRAVSVLTRLILTCCRYLNDQKVSVIVSQIVVPLWSVSCVEDDFLLALRNDVYHCQKMEPLDIFLSLEMFGFLLNSEDIFSRFMANVLSLNVAKEDILERLFQIVSGCSQQESAFCKAFSVTSKLLSYFPVALQPRCTAQVWQNFTRSVLTSAGNVDRELVWQSLYVFYCLKDYFFPLDVAEKEELSSKISSNNFWAIIQAGLVSVELSHRKLAMYLLKRLVDTCNKNCCSVSSAQYECHSHQSSLEGLPLFWWAPGSAAQLSVIWEDFILLVETLEEKQAHIIKPLLPRMQKLIAASMLTQEGHPRFHSSWLVTIVTRCFQHDSHYMSRWGAHTLLTLDFVMVPLIPHGQLRFLSHDLLIYLQENKLYSRYEGTELGKSSPVGAALRTFFANLFGTLTREQKVEYLDNLLRIVCENSWGSVPLTFVFEGLSHIPACPVIGQELQLIRQILVSCLRTHEVLTRGAIQCFICEMMIKLTDLESVSLSEFFATLAALNREESLRRDTTLWKAVVSWLGSDSVCEKWKDTEIFKVAKDYLHESIKDEDSSIITGGYKATRVARMLVLFADVTEQRLSEQVPQQPELDISRTLESSPLGLTLAQIAESLTDIRSRAYVSSARVDRCLSLMFSLSQEFGNFKSCHVDKMLKASLTKHFKDAVFHVKNRLSQTLNQAGDLDEVKFYTNMLFSLGQLSDRCGAELKELIVFVGRIFSLVTQEKPDSEAELDMLSMSAMQLLSAVLKLTISDRHTEGCERSQEMMRAVHDMVSVQDVPLPFSRKTSSKEQISKAHMGQVIGRFISSKWKCQKYIFEHWNAGKSGSGQGMVRETFDAAKILHDAMEDLSIGSGSSDVSVFQALEVVMGELVMKVNAEVIIKLLQLAWNKVMEETKNIRFWKKLKCFIPLVLHSSLLLQERSSAVGLTIDEFLDKLFTLGTDKAGVMYLVFDHLCHRVLRDDPDWKIATRIIPHLVDGCYLGTLHKRGERLWLDVCAYIENLGDLCTINEITSSAPRNDLCTRIIILNWLSQLRPNVPADQKFVAAFLQLLRSTYMRLATHSSHKQFANSLSHRQKHRIVLVFLLLLDFITESESGEYLSMLWHALDMESHASVRQMLEWLIMILIVRYPDGVSQMWKVFKLYDNKRSVCLCSLFLVISHVGTYLPVQMQEKYYGQALATVLPWTMAHHYNTRIFAQAALTCLWGQCKTLGLDVVVSQHSVLQSAIEFLSNNGNASATVSKLLNSYMYNPFDPLKDFSMETIFYTLPRLACLADDEWIQPQQFVQMDHTWEETGQHLIPLRNSSDKLASCKEGAWRMKAPNDGEDDAATNDRAGGGDVQKKIMPWRQMSPSEETEADFASQQEKRSEGGLVMVTSLIDKVPNLGGLCRTCEIFGVSEFVIGNLTYLEDKMFQSLSVSAQKWIRITEVMLPRLTEFLEDKRSQGYTLVGVEQTANSVSLQEYKFPKKTLLLLGNEREGIPVDIIQLLDVCVEIPQFGVIRSLNVHVCGALIVWEYTRQHMGSKPAAAAVFVQK